MSPAEWLFPQWKRLPLEIRLMIWRTTFEPRVISMIQADMKVTALELCLRRLGWDKCLPVQDVEDAIATARKGLVRFKKFPPMTWTPGSGASYSEEKLVRQVEKAIEDLRAKADANSTPAKHVDLQELAFTFLDNGVSLVYLRPLLGMPEPTSDPEIEVLEILVNYLPDGIHDRFQFGSTLYPDRPSNRQKDADFMLSPFRSCKPSLGPPSILAVCRESRSFALEHYQLAFTTNAIFGTYFNFEMDTLYLRYFQDFFGYYPPRTLPNTRVANFLSWSQSPIPIMSKSMDAKKIKNIAIETPPVALSPYPSFRPSCTSASREHISQLQRVLPAFSNTEKITVLVHHELPSVPKILLVDPLDFDKATLHYARSLASIVGDPADLALDVKTFCVKQEDCEAHLDRDELRRKIDGILPKIEYKFAVGVDRQKKLGNLIKACKNRMIKSKWSLDRKAQGRA